MENWIKIGIGGPVGSGKSHLLLRICESLRELYSIVVITNDIYTREDAQFLTNQKALEQGRIIGVETGGCPHAAIRDDISLNQDALNMMKKKFPEARLAFIESGGDNLSATFSPELVDYQIYIIDVAQGGDIPRKGGIGIARSDLLVVNKIDLAPYVDVDLKQMESDIQAARGPLGFVMTNLKTNSGVSKVTDWIQSLLDEDANLGRKEALWAGKPTLQSSTLSHHHHHEHHEH